MFPVLDDRRQSVVCGGRLHRIVQLDVGELGPAYDFLLLRDGKVIPSRKVMQILLHDHVTAACEGRVLFSDDGGTDGALIHRILRPIDEAEQVAIVEVTETVYLVDDGNGTVEPRHDLCRQLEAQIHAYGADMQQNVPWRGDRVMAAVYLTERMQSFRLGCPEETIPRVGAKRHDARQPPLEIPKPYCA